MPFRLTPGDDETRISQLPGPGKIAPEQGQWRIYFLGFARSGWTSGALAYQEQINLHPVSGANWTSAGLRLLTLEQVDHDLAAWST